ncbi:unnamed protein product, partial [Hapterophycus canaliculatus]
PFALEGGDSINKSINRYLRGYQREGVRWLHAKYKAGQGGILGDDMGLGKTVQSITLLSAVLRKTGEHHAMASSFCVLYPETEPVEQGGGL